MSTEQLQIVRNLLLNLHKTLLVYERRAYEGQHGKINSPGIMLGLVMENKNFDWLRQLSGIIVGLDELLENQQPISKQKFIDAIKYIEHLLIPNINGGSFAKKYFFALQSHPDSALIHSKIQHILKTLPK